MMSLRGKVAGEGAGPEEIVRAECVLGVLRSRAISLPEYELRLVREVILPATRSVLNK